MRIPWRSIAYYGALVILSVIVVSGPLTMLILPFDDFYLSEHLGLDPSITFFGILIALPLVMVVLAARSDESRRQLMLKILTLLTTADIAASLLMHLPSETITHAPTTGLLATILDNWFGIGGIYAEDSWANEVWLEYWVASIAVLSLLWLVSRQLMQRR